MSKITEKQFLEDYNPAVFDRPSTAVDSVIFTIKEGGLHVLLLKRSDHPFMGKWALVGGYIDMKNDVDLEATAIRKLNEKTALECAYLEQVCTVGDSKRDPRGWTVSTCYFALLAWQEMSLSAGRGAEDIAWVTVEEAMKKSLAFDHNRLLNLSLERLRAKSLYTTLPVNLMDEEFTLLELQAAYEIILNQPIQAKSFRRRIENSKVTEETGNFKPTGKRPAMLYRKIDQPETYFFTRTIESLG